MEESIEPKKEKEQIFEDLPESLDEPIYENENEDEDTKSQPIPIQEDRNQNNLALILNADLRDLELMIRGLQYVKRFNKLLQREEIILEKIPDHPLNEYGINTIMAELRVYSSPEIKLGRKNKEMYAHSVMHIGRSITRLIYKNLKNFGMTTQSKQRHAKRFCNAIIEILDSSYSRSIEGQENDASRPTEYVINSNMSDGQDFGKQASKQLRDNMKN